MTKWKSASFCSGAGIGECKRHACVDQKHARHPESCSCMEDIVLEGNQLEEAVDYLFGFALLTRQEQQTIVIEWIKYSVNIGTGYL